MIEALTAIGFLIALTASIQSARAETPVSCSSDVPLPPNVKITPAVPDVPKNIATFVGKWCGVLSSNGRDIIVQVDSVEKSGRASVAYALSKSFRFPAFYLSMPGTIDNGVLRFTLPDQGQAKLKYQLVNENEMAGEWTRGVNRVRMTLHRGE